MVYNVTNPQNPQFVQYLNNRDFSADKAAVEAGQAGDLGPEGLAFIRAEDSPNGQPILAVGNEVSGTTTLYGIDVVGASRSEERRVGKECRYRWSRDDAGREG